MKNCFVFVVVSFMYACSSLPTKNKRDYYIPKIETKRVQRIKGQLSILKCNEAFTNKYVMKFNKNKDSLIFSSSINLCELYKEDLSKGDYIISVIDLSPSKDMKTLKYRRYQYGVFDTDKKLLFKKSGGGIYCFIQDYEAFKKSIHYKLSDAKFTILKTTKSLDSIATIHMVNKLSTF